MFFKIASLALAVMLTGCSDSDSPARSPAQSGARYLALGDSYTIGEGVSAVQRWPVQLAQRLRSEGVEVADPRIIARTGWTTDELASAIEQEQPDGPFDLVTLLIGVNNQYRDRPAEEYRGEFRSLLQTSIELAGGEASRVVVLSIPDWGATPFGESDARGSEQIGQVIDQFNEIAREEAQGLGVTFVDVTPLSRRATDDPSLVAADGLHPSGRMYAQWAELALPSVRAALRAEGD